jgi:septum formation protein
MSRTLLLASASVARYSLLSSAGVHPVVQVSHVDEDALIDDHPGATTAELVEVLAAAKGEAVAAGITATEAADILIVACDSMLEFDGRHYGKPGSPEAAVERWRMMRGRSGRLHTGHWLHDTVTGQTRTAVAGADVYFADVTDDEIDAYVATGEPLGVAGAFTHEGRSAAFISRMDGDGPAVGGISLHLLRQLTAEMGIAWHTLWTAH